MLKNYFSIAFRHFLRNKTFSFINIAGLAIGISASLVIFLIVQYDFSFDKFHKDGDRIYRVVSDFEFSGEKYHNSGVTVPLGDAARKQLTGLELAVPFYTFHGDTKISVPNTSSNNHSVFKKQKDVVSVDKDYFKLINYKWLAGSPGSALQLPNKVVLTESIAKQYFPSQKIQELVGKELLMNDTVRFLVSGIVKDIDQRTDFHFKVFISRATLENTSIKPSEWDQWNNTNGASQLIVKLSPGTSISKIEKALYNLYDKNRTKEPGDVSKSAFALQPLGDIHFNTDYGNFDQRTAHKPTLYGLLAVAGFLLLLGCINFINLTTAQASQRAKEIGVRKTMGSSKGQLVFQFLSETLLLTIIATLFSLALTPLLLKVFANFIPAGLHFDIFRQPVILLFLGALTLCVTLLAGFYPALILSAFKPVDVIKNQAQTNTGKTRNAFLRKTLTVSQFVIAQVFIIATILVSKQINYSLNKDLGFKKDAIIYFTTKYFDHNPNRRFLLVEKLKAIPEIAMISLSNSPPSSNNTWSSTMKYKDGKKEINHDVQVKLGDSNYLSLYKIKLLAGSLLPPGDTVNSMIINETYSKKLGFESPDKAIGNFIEWDNKQVPIVGVAADFHQKSLHENIKPLIITNITKQTRTINIALQPQYENGTVWSSAIKKIEKNWKDIYPDDDFQYSFIDESIAKYYKSEQNISRLLIWATGLAIFISCLGLLGLVMFITNQRTKEIGIRKVVGASITQIITLLSKDFLKLVAIALIIAIPISWWGTHNWLQNFAYKTTLSWWIFAAGGLIMFLMAMIILTIRTFKAAAANPVKSLRTE